MKLLRVTVDRSKWDVGRNQKVLLGATRVGRLYDTETKLHCCLGFVGLTCGIPLRRLADMRTPENVRSKKWPVGLITAGETSENTGEATSLMVTNDSDHMISSVQEKRIITQGREAGIAFRFVGKYLKKVKKGNN